MTSTDTAHPLADDTAPTWLHLKDVVAGAGRPLFALFRQMPFSHRNHLCEPTAWRAMRAHAYAAAAVAHVPAPLQPTQQVTIFGSNAAAVEESRRLLNDEELAAELRRALPAANVTVVEIADLAVDEQIAVLARTTLLISMLGSKSFRLAFLPDGAQVRPCAERGSPV